MEHEKHYQVVHSTYDGLYQHDGFSWQVLGTQFVHLDDVSREGKLVDEALSAWADSLNTQQREALADALYSVFTASGAKTLSDLNEEKLKSAAGDAQDLQKSRPRDPAHGHGGADALFPPEHKELCSRHAGGEQPRDREYPQKDL